jgi:hypothetical protein
MEQIAKERGIQWTHVPFRGTSESTSALLGGHINAVADASGWAPLGEGGQLRLLVIWTDQRAKTWPNLPTLKEAGIAMVSNSPFGLAGPKGMDPRIVQVLHDAFKKGMEEPSYLATMAKIDQEPFYLKPADYRAFVMRTVVEQKQLMGERDLSRSEVRNGASDDPKAERRQIPALFAKEESQDWTAAQSRHVLHQEGGGEARAGGAIFQAALTPRGSGRDAVQIVLVGAFDLHRGELADTQRLLAFNVDGTIDLRRVAF